MLDLNLGLAFRIIGIWHGVRLPLLLLGCIKKKKLKTTIRILIVVLDFCLKHPHGMHNIGFADGPSMSEINKW